MATREQSYEAGKAQGTIQEKAGQAVGGITDMAGQAKDNTFKAAEAAKDKVTGGSEPTIGERAQETTGKAGEALITAKDKVSETARDATKGSEEKKGGGIGEQIMGAATGAADAVKNTLGMGDK